MTEKTINSDENEENVDERGFTEEDRYSRGYRNFLKTIRAKDNEDEAPLWLITFTDIMALMLTFFVLLYSMSSPDVDQWDEMTSAVNSGFSQSYSPRLFAGAQDTINIERVTYNNALDLNYLDGLVQDLISQDEALKDTLTLVQKNRLIISLPQDLLFESGQADLGQAGEEALFELGVLLSRVKNRIEVIGHTDPNPIQSDQFSSNWALSLSRASEVANLMEAAGYEAPILIRGLSSARYEELSGDLSPEQRLGLARRVDVVVLKNDGNTRMMMTMEEGG